jgi:PAS domain S-box-containing protein
VSAERSPGDQPSAPELVARLAAIVASADDAIVSKTLDGVITSWNRAAEAMFGYTSAEAVGRPITLIIPAERLHEEVEILSRLRRGEAIEHFETERVTKDGRRLPISLSVSPVMDVAGRVIGVAKIARDISDRYRAEARIRESLQIMETLYRLADRVGRAKVLDDVCDAGIAAIMGVGPDRAGVLLLDERGVMRFCAWRNLSEGYRAAVEGHSPWPPDAVDPSPVVVEDVRTDPAMAALRDVVSAEGIRSLAFVPLVHQGRLVGKFMAYYDAPHAFSVPEIRLANGIAQHVAFGVTRVRAEAAVEELLARERAAGQEAEAARAEAEDRRRVAEELTRLAGDVNESLDATAVGERVVRAAVTLFAARASSLRLMAADGSLVAVAFGGRTRDTFEPGHALAAGPASVSGLAVMHGAAMWSADILTDPRLSLTPELARAMEAADAVTVLAVPLRAKGRIFGSLSVARGAGREFTQTDAATLQALADQSALAIRNSQLFAAEQAARGDADAANHAKDRFLAVLSHELRTPLNAILGWARLLRTAPLPDTERTRGLEVIERNARLQAQLVADLIDVSRIRAGKMDVECEPVDLVLVARQAIEAMASEAAHKKIALVAELDESRADVFGDPGRLQQMVTNVLANAVKFTPEGGRVDVRLTRAAGRARLAVADSGEGIEPELLARIFDPFEQGDSSSTRRHQGLGLGLAIVRQLVEAHSGTIAAESPGKGHGATFTIELPLMPGAVSPAARPSGSSR